MSKTITEKLTDFALNLNFADLPLSVVRKAKECLLDLLGCAIGGTGTEAGQHILSLVAEEDCSGSASVIGAQGRNSCLNAALANGVLGHSLQFDDGSRVAQGHPGTVVIPAILAAGETAEIDGKGLLVSLVVGYEAFIRIGEAINPSHIKRGFHTTGTVGTVAAALAASKAFGLSREQTLDALGLAGSIAGGLMEYAVTGSMSTYLIAGNAARNGVLAALLGKRGFTGPVSIIEGEKGFFRAMSDGQDTEKATLQLGQRFRIEEVYFKPYPSCRHTHAAIEAAIELVKRYGIDFRQVERVVVDTYSLALDECNLPEPTTIAGADSSLQFCVATAIRYGRFTLAERSLENLWDPATRALAQIVALKKNPALDALVPQKRPAMVTIVTKDGASYTYKQDHAKGEPERAMSMEELLGKFTACTSEILSVEKRKKILDLIAILETLDSLEPLMAELRFRSQTHL
ncbi:MAG: MmgE/PrpD family protein [Chloroflexi bacterium]|nr:MmgE/PrpD family protein [Chloroflexota bacterium]MCL5075398.1 MmgE/PrpD family protein [Chloroflexota bacterium]